MRDAPPAGLLLGLLLAVALHAFHAMAVAPVVPRVAVELDGMSLYGAAFGAPLLASILGLLWAGASSARRGPAATLARGLTAFTAGLVVCGCAGSMPVWLLGRALEGFGGGVSTTVLYAAVTRAYPEAQRPQVLAWMSGAWVLPGLLGPPLAGAVADAWSWRLVFLGIAPAVALAAGLALPPLARLAAPGPLRAAASWPGGSEAGGSQPGRALAKAARLAGSALLARAGLGAALALKFLLHFCFFGVEAFLPLALGSVLGWSTFEIGVVMTVAALSWTTGAFLNARLVERIAPGAAGSAGVGLLLLGCGGLLASLVAGLREAWIYPCWALAGLGMGMAYNTAAAAVMAATRRGDEGRTASAQGIADALGFALAACVGGGFVAAAEGAGSPLLDAIALSWGVSIAAGLLALPCLWRNWTGASRALDHTIPSPGVPLCGEEAIHVPHRQKRYSP